MDQVQVIALCALYRRRRRQRRNRLYWIHPINQSREEMGIFYSLFGELRKDERKFFNYFRMSVGSFDELHQKLKNVLQRQNTKFRNCVQPIEMLAMTLRYLASGCTFTDLHYNYRVGISTARKFVREVCTAIWLVMREEFIPTPTSTSWKSIASNFESIANFPHCLGAVDGKHIRLTSPFDSGSMYYNYKDYFSIVLMAVADTKYRFVYVDIGSYGKECDSLIFKRSKLWRSIDNGSHEIPEEQPLLGTESPKIPYFFVGDEAFGLHKHLMRPFGGNHLTTEKRVFNYRLCRARRYVECAFGILSNKWRVFHRPLNVQPDFAVLIVKACIVLHNYVRDRDGYLVEDTMTITGLEDLSGEKHVRGGSGANHIRSVLSRYFLSNVGSVPWQMSNI